MVKINIGFQDLKEDTQEEVWVLVSKHLLDEGWVQRETGESEDAFLDRLWDETGSYLNTHTVAGDYQL